MYGLGWWSFSSLHRETRANSDSAYEESIRSSSVASNSLASNIQPKSPKNDNSKSSGRGSHTSSVTSLDDEDSSGYARIEDIQLMKEKIKKRWPSYLWYALLEVSKYCKRKLSSFCNLFLDLLHESLVCEKFRARDTQMFLWDNRNISCLHDRQMMTRLSLACLATLGDTPNTVSRVTSLIV